MAITISGSTLQFPDTSAFAKSYPTFLSYINLNNVASATVTGIPSTARKIWIALDETSTQTNVTDLIGLRLGTSAGLQTSGYYNSISNGSSSSVAGTLNLNNSYFSMNTTNSYFYGWNSVQFLSRYGTTNYWSWSIIGGAFDRNGTGPTYARGQWGAGYVNLSSSADRVQVLTSLGNVMWGKMYVYYGA